jgi:DNA-binding phage protein
MAPVDYGLTSGAGTAAASSTGILDTLTSAGSSVLDFAKQNPQLTGSILGAIGGAVSAANAPKEQTTTTSIDPQIKAEYLANLERAKAAAAGLGVREFAGFTDDYGLAETQLKNLGLGGKGQQTTDEAARLAMIEAGFTPQQIAAAQADRSAVQDVTGQLGSQYMSAYFNPYEEQVVQGTLGDIERSRQMQDVADRARAVQARAFGGSRQGVQSALTNEAALRQAGTTAAGLRQAGFAQAAQFGQSDAARQLQAQMANQGVSLTLEQANAQLRQQAALANQQAGISGAGLRQSAINQLGNLGAQQQNLGMTGANAVMLAQMERQKLEQQRLDAMRNLPLERLGITGGALGLQPANTGGTTSQPLYTSTLGSALSGGLTGSYIGSLLQPKPQPVP